MKVPRDSHPEDDRLRAYGLGRLDGRPAEEVHHHLKGCRDCSLRVAELSSDSFLGRLREAGVRADAPSAGVLAAGCFSTDSQAARLVVSGGSSKDGEAAPLVAAAPPPPESLPKALAEHPDYEILRELGRGGMGVVYLARNTLMGRLEVLKVVSERLTTSGGVLERFLVEIRSVARLKHPNIVTAYAAIRLDPGLALAMEYIEGRDLACLVARGPLPVANACGYIHQAALGLQHAHELGMVHRDIKPGNLMLTRQGSRALIKVLDFGLSKVKSEASTALSLTGYGRMLGTPHYMAPEQIRDARGADIRADIYSLGCTLYCLLKGTPPFEAENLYDLCQAHNSMDAALLNQVRPEVPAEVAALVAKMMAKEPRRRFQEPKEVAEALIPYFRTRNGTSDSPSDHGTARASLVPETTGGVRISASGDLQIHDLGELLEAPSSHVVPARSEAPLSHVAPPRSATDARKAPARTSRPSASRQGTFGEVWRRRIGGIIASGLLAAMIGLLWAAMDLRIKTPDGVLVLEGLPRDAEVILDGKVTKVSWPGSGRPVEIRVHPGRREVEVKKDGFQTFGRQVNVREANRFRLTVRLIPLIPPPSPRPEAGLPERSPPTVQPESAADGRIGAGTGRTAPPPDRSRVFLFDEFSNPRSGWPRDGRTHDYAGGRYFIEAPPNAGDWGWNSPKNPVPEHACRVIGRALGDERSSWGVVVSTTSETTGRGFQVRVNRKGELFLEPGFWGRDRFRDDPRTGPIVHPAIRNGDDFNKLLLIVRRRQVEIYVNDVAVCQPVRFDWDVAPAVFCLASFGVSTQKTRAEFEEIEIRELGDSARPSGGLANGPGGARPAEADESGFVPLLNGPELSGWIFPFGDRADWKVDDGVLHGSASTYGSTIETVRSDFGDFHLRMEMLIEDRSASAILIRSASSRMSDRNYRFGMGGMAWDGIHPPGDYAVRNGGPYLATDHTGPNKEGLTSLLEPRSGQIPANSWQAVEIIAIGNTFRLLVNRQEVSAFRDDRSLFVRGRIGFRLRIGARIGLRNMRIKEGRPATSADVAPTGVGAASADRATLGQLLGAKGVSQRATAVVGRGDWKVEGDELCLLDAGGEEWLLFGDRGWRDYDYRFEVLQEGRPSGISALFRSPDDGRIQHFGIGWHNFRTSVMEFADGGRRCNAMLLDGHPTHRVLDEPIQSGCWYELKVVVRGKTTRAYCDDKLIFETSANPFDAGRIGVRTWRSWRGKTRFRNIRVTSPDGTILWNGPPEIAA